MPAASPNLGRVRATCLYLLRLWLVPVVILLWLRGQGPLLIQRLTVDVTALCGVPSYTGLLSNAGVALWLSGAAILFFAAGRVPRQRRQALLLPALLSLMLGLDDALMLHEELVPQWTGLDDRVVQPGLYCCYAAMLLGCLPYHRQRMAQPLFLVFLAALACLGGSVAVDVLKDSKLLSPRSPLMLDEGFAMWLEDGLKLLGIVAWTGYWVAVAGQTLDEDQ